MRNLTDPQVALVATEFTNDPYGLGYAQFVTTTSVDQLIDLLTFIRDGVTPCPDNSIIGKSGAITGATNAGPIVITSAAHGLSTGDAVTISGVLGNLAANNVPLNPDGVYTSAPNETWTITKVNANSFSLNSSTGNGAYTSGGTWQWAVATLANGTKLFNPTVAVKDVIAQISPTDSAGASALTGTQAIILPAWLNPNGMVALTDSSGVETQAAGWLQLLTQAGSNSRKAVKALETRFGSRIENLLNVIGIVPTEDDMHAALGH